MPTHSMRALENSVQRLLAKSRTAAKLAVKIRNQADCVIAYHLGESTNSEQNGEFALVEHLSSNVKTYIDVGANIGAWSECMVKHASCNGFLFEPSGQCVKVLKERFRERNVVIRDVAVSDQIGTAQFAEERNCGEKSSLSETRADSGSIQYREVLVTTLDTEFAAPELRIDFLKIDTEGYDLKVMKGATNLLSRTRFLQFEYNSYWIAVGSSLSEASRFLSKLGFSIFLVRSTGLHPLRYEFWNDYFRYSNYFACRSADLEVVRPLLRDPI